MIFLQAQFSITITTKGLALNWETRDSTRSLSGYERNLQEYIKVS